MFFKRLTELNTLEKKTVVVTGGAGFLGREVCRLLESHHPRAIIAPRSKSYDLREKDAIEQLLNDSCPDVIIHLAAVVGGIEANRLNPGKFFYENAIMGLHMIEAGRQ